MDAETRHQLKQNELAEALAKLRDFSDRRFWYLLLAVLVVMLAYAGYRVRGWQVRQNVASGWETLMSLDTRNPAVGRLALEQLRTFIDSTSQENLRVAGRLKLGLTLKQQAIVEGNLEKAGKALEELNAIVEDARAPAQFRAAALYNVALAHESLEQFDEARQAYERLNSEQAFAGLPFRELAVGRLETLEEVREPVALQPGFPPAPEPPPLPPTTAPADALGPPVGEDTSATDALTEQSAEPEPAAPDADAPEAAAEPSAGGQDTEEQPEASPTTDEP